jgi:Saxitoxin biosynthesis operon protein SxtJ
MNDKYFGAHEFQAREEVVKISSERGFGLVFAGFFTLLGALSVYNGGDRWHYWFPLAALFAVLAYAAPRVLAPLNRLWAKFGLLLHHIISPLFLGILFYVCVTPFGVLMRLAGKDPLRRKFEPAAKSYWIVREPPGPAPETFKNQF